MTLWTAMTFLYFHGQPESQHESNKRTSADRSMCTTSSPPGTGCVVQRTRHAIVCMWTIYKLNTFNEDVMPIMPCFNGVVILVIDLSSQVSDFCDCPLACLHVYRASCIDSMQICFTSYEVQLITAYYPNFVYKKQKK